MFRLAWALAAVALLAALAHGAPGRATVFNVKQFGAAGDGKSDDTAAIQAALDQAKVGPRGSTVTLPPGQYRVAKTLAVENALLKGLEAGGWPADAGPLPTLLVDHTDGPCILARSAASIHGLNFEYGHKGEHLHDRISSIIEKMNRFR